MTQHQETSRQHGNGFLAELVHQILLKENPCSATKQSVLITQCAETKKKNTQHSGSFQYQAKAKQFLHSLNVNCDDRVLHLLLCGYTVLHIGYFQPIIYCLLQQSVKNPPCNVGPSDWNCKPSPHADLHLHKFFGITWSNPALQEQYLCFPVGPVWNGSATYSLCCFWAAYKQLLW